MNEVMGFEETESLNEDIFDCEYTSVDAVINEVTVFTGCLLYTSPSPRDRG